MSELTCLQAGALLWLVHVLVQAGTAGTALPLSYLLSSRDQPMEPKGLLAGRARRALANYLESFPVFAALDLGFLVLHQDGGVWPAIWIFARSFYLPCYLKDIIYARSIFWGISFVAILMMLVRLTFG